MPALLRRALALALTCCVAVTSWGGAYVPCDDVGASTTTGEHRSMARMGETDRLADMADRADMGHSDMPAMPRMAHHGSADSDAPCDHGSHSSGRPDATSGTCQLGLHCVAVTMVADVPLGLEAPPRSDTPLAWPASVLRNHAVQPEAPPPKG